MSMIWSGGVSPPAIPGHPPTADTVVLDGVRGTVGDALWWSLFEGDMAGPGDLAPDADAIVRPGLLEHEILVPPGIYPMGLPGDAWGHVPEAPSLWLLLGVLVPVAIIIGVRRWRARRARRLPADGPMTPLPHPDTKPINNEEMP